MSSPLLSFLPPPGTNLEQYISDQVSMGNATRYTILVTYIIVLWDTLLLLPDEIDKMWRAQHSWFRTAFLANHYLSIAAMTLIIVATCGLTPRLSDEFCRVASSTGVVVGALSVGAALYLVLLKVWALWDHTKWVMWATTAVWLGTFLATMIMVTLTIRELLPRTFSAAPFGLNICALNYKPDIMKGIWASPLALEIVVLVMTGWNAFDRPRSADVSLAKTLLRDGILFFASLFSLHLLNLILTILSPATIAYVGSCLVWGVSNMLLTRLVLRQTPSADAVPRIPLPLTVTKVRDAVHFEIERQSHDDMSMSMTPLSTPSSTPLPPTPTFEYHLSATPQRITRTNTSQHSARDRMW